MTAIVLSLVAAYGVHLIYSAAVFGWTGIQPGPIAPARRQDRIGAVIRGLGLGEFDPRALVAAVLVLSLTGFAFGTLLFGGLAPAILIGFFAATTPIGVARLRHERVTNHAHQAWPAIIEEIRLLTGTLGRSIPQATFEVGRRSHDGLRGAFEAAHREWLISTDFARSLEVLKSQLSHHTADIVAETLLTAHELGGGEVGNRLGALAQDRMTDQQHRRDAVARQAGVRFARWFTLIVPAGMALTGLSIGRGREAYGTTLGQMFVAVALLMIVACWVWAGRIMRMPTEERVFA
ncbi:MAG: tight adherence protein B [Verrucomicrobiales bacterium]